MSTSKNYLNFKWKIKSFLIYQKMWNIKSISFCGIIHPIIIILLIFCNFIATKCCIFSMKQKWHLCVIFSVGLSQMWMVVYTKRPKISHLKPFNSFVWETTWIIPYSLSIFYIFAFDILICTCSLKLYDASHLVWCRWCQKPLVNRFEMTANEILQEDFQCIMT